MNNLASLVALLSVIATIALGQKIPLGPQPTYCEEESLEEGFYLAALFQDRALIRMTPTVVSKHKQHLMKEPRSSTLPSPPLKPTFNYTSSHLSFRAHSQAPNKKYVNVEPALKDPLAFIETDEDDSGKGRLGVVCSTVREQLGSYFVPDGIEVGGLGLVALPDSEGRRLSFRVKIW